MGGPVKNTALFIDILIIYECRDKGYYVFPFSLYSYNKKISHFLPSQKEKYEQNNLTRKSTNKTM